MTQQSVILTFSKELVDKPIISKLIKSFDIEVNILQARITPKRDGNMFTILKGDKKALDSSLKYLDEMGVHIVLPVKNLGWFEEKCVHCGACVSRCISGAFSVNKQTYKVEFDSEKCIACELCIPACSFNAIESISEHLQKQGGR